MEIAYFGPIWNVHTNFEDVDSMKYDSKHENNIRNVFMDIKLTLEHDIMALITYFGENVLRSPSGFFPPRTGGNFPPPKFLRFFPLASFFLHLENMYIWGHDL